MDGYNLGKTARGRRLDSYYLCTYIHPFPPHPLINDTIAVVGSRFHRQFQRFQAVSANWYWNLHVDLFQTEGSLTSVVLRNGDSETLSPHG